MNTRHFLNWIADRLVQVHGENENVDYVLKLREIADKSTDEYDAVVDLYYAANNQPIVQVGEATRTRQGFIINLWTMPTLGNTWNGGIKLLPKKEA